MFATIFFVLPNKPINYRNLYHYRLHTMLCIKTLLSYVDRPPNCLGQRDYLVYPSVPNSSRTLTIFLTIPAWLVRLAFSLILRTARPARFAFCTRDKWPDYTGFPPTGSVCPEIKGC